MTSKTGKCLFTLPSKLLRDANDLIGRLGPALASNSDGRRFSRDRYLSNLLAEELRTLRALPKNSKRAQAFLIDELKWSRNKSDRQANISLEPKVAAELKYLCNSKGIPRDLLMTAFLEAVVAGLRKIADVGTEPTHREWINQAPFSHLTLSDEDIDEQQGLVAEALAEMKSISVSWASEAYRNLPLAQRKAIRTNPRVRVFIAKLRRRIARAKPLDLDELLNDRPRRSSPGSRAAQR